MIKIELQFTTIAEAVTFLSARQTDAGPVATDLKVTTQPAPEAKAPADLTPAPAPAPAAEPAHTEPTAPVVEVAAPEKKEQPSGKALDYALDVSPKIAAAAKTNRDAVVAALGKFGVKKGTELTPEQWSAFVAEMDEILGA